MAEPIDVSSDDALGDHDAVGLIGALARRSVSAQELRSAATARAVRAQKALNAVAYWVPQPLPSDGTFSGIPTFVKDNLDLADAPTRFGSRATSSRPVRSEAKFVKNLQELGFTILGKTTMPEFGLTASTESLACGPTRNPRNPDFSSGGSSGGAAALVGARAIPIAHANDGGGSIRIPASICGLVGLKPSRGRVADSEAMKNLPVLISAQGILSRSVRDTALFFAEMEKIDPRLPPIGHIKAPSGRRLKIGVVSEGLPGLPVSSDVQAAVRNAAKACAALGHHVELIANPITEQFGRDFLRYWAALAFTIGIGGKRAFGPDFDRTKLEPFTNGLSGLFKHVAVRTPGTMLRLRRFGDEYAASTAAWDVVVSPVLSHAPPPLGYFGPEVDFSTHLTRLLRYASFTAVQNVAGNPAISLPLAVSSDGLPIGVQFDASFGQEATLLELAYELEESAGWN